MRDLFRRGVLSWAAGEVFAVLESDPQSVAELVERARRKRRTVYDALKRLEAKGLAARTETGWVRGLADPVAVSRELGADERTRKAKQAIAAERAKYQRDLKRRGCTGKVYVRPMVRMNESAVASGADELSMPGGRGSPPASVGGLAA